jgi:Septum formation initiator
MLKKKLLYIVTTLAFLVYVGFISDSNIEKHLDLNRQIDNLNLKIAQTRNDIAVENEYKDLISDAALLEKYGREQLDMHKPNEDVFIFVYE